jgi:isocitrate dehydrogenase (NAD+)
LEHIGQHKIAERINQAIWDVLEEGRYLTGDLGGTTNTQGFTDALIDKL